MLTQPKLSDHEPALGSLMADLSRQMGVLMREELHLARAELSEKVLEVRRDVAFLTAAAMLAHAGLLVLLGALVALMISVGTAPWLAALLIAVAALVVSATLAIHSLTRLRNASLAPQQTIETLKEDARWAQDQIHHP